MKDDYPRSLAACAVADVLLVNPVRDGMNLVAQEGPVLSERGCALVNAAVELPEKSHPARRVIEEFKTAERTRLTQVCRATGLSDPDVLAEELHLMLEGARVTAQSVGRDGLSERVMRMSEALIAAHTGN